MIMIIIIIIIILMMMMIIIIIFNCSITVPLKSFVIVMKIRRAV